MVNPRSCTLRTSDASTISYSLMGALVGPGSGSMLRGGLPQLREWHKKWGREHGRGEEVAACERFREEEVARLARLLGMGPEEAAGLAEAPEEDH